MPDPIMTTPRAPYDRYRARHASPQGNSPSGPADGGIGRTVPFGVLREGDGANVWDRLTNHERMPWYDRDYGGSHHDSLVNWTDSGPIRPSLHMLQATVRKLVGTDNTRNYDPHPRERIGVQDQGHGMHSNPSGRSLTLGRYRNTAQMRPTRINRLTSARYAGQSYSQTTR